MKGYDISEDQESVAFNKNQKDMDFTFRDQVFTLISGINQEQLSEIVELVADIFGIINATVSRFQTKVWER